MDLDELSCLIGCSGRKFFFCDLVSSRVFDRPWLVSAEVLSRGQNRRRSKRAKKGRFSSETYDYRVAEIRFPNLLKKGEKFLRFWRFLVAGPTAVARQARTALSVALAGEAFGKKSGGTNF